MKNSLIGVMIILILASCSHGVEHARKVEVKIYGNCGKCKKTIEEAANIKGEAYLSWDKESKMASLIYDTTKTTQEVVLKRIADAGYDNELYHATDSSYDNLHECCHYERAK